MPNHIISKYTWFILLGGHKTTKLFGIGFYAHDIISRFIEKTDKTIILDLLPNEKIIGSKMITLGLTSLLFVSTFSLVFWSSMIDNTFFFVTEFWRTEVHVKAYTHSKRTGISLHDHKCLKTCLPSSLALPTAYCVLRQEHLFDLKSKVKNHTCTYPKQIIPCFVTKSESITLDLQKFIYLRTRE